MTLEAIKEAIEQLPPEEQTILASWLTERNWKAWDEQIERDFSPGGRAMPLLAELEREIAEGKTRPMEEGFAERRKSRRRIFNLERSPDSGSVALESRWTVLVGAVSGSHRALAIDETLISPFLR